MDIYRTLKFQKKSNVYCLQKHEKDIAKLSVQDYEWLMIAYLTNFNKLSLIIGCGTKQKDCFKFHDDFDLAIVKSVSEIDQANVNLPSLALDLNVPTTYNVLSPLMGKFKSIFFDKHTSYFMSNKDMFYFLYDLLGSGGTLYFGIGC